jgi:putative acetyltransferase
MSLPVTLDRCLDATDEVIALISELDLGLSHDYSAEQQHGLAIASLFEAHIRFFIAREGTTAVGCGGVALFQDFAELKRMFVRDAARGSGVATALLECIEKEARDAGLKILRLETGDRQARAIRFYERSGFRRCHSFEPYSSMPSERIAKSLFFEKYLA